MKKCPFSWRSLAASVAVCSAAASIAAAPAMADPGFAQDGSSAAADCSAPALSQPFLNWGDSNLYALAPGESADNFAGDGWTLGNGASVTTTQLADGTSGAVLNLPGAAYAVSPPVCVDSTYMTARTMIESAPGTFVGVGVSYAGPHRMRFSGLISGSGNWSPSDPFQIHPGNLPGWQLVRFYFGNLTPAGNAQLYNFYIDPRMSD